MKHPGLFRQTLGTLRENYLPLLAVVIGIELLTLAINGVPHLIARWEGVDKLLYGVAWGGESLWLWVAIVAVSIFMSVGQFMVLCLYLGFLRVCLDGVEGKRGLRGLTFCFQRRRFLKCLGAYALCCSLPGILHGVIRPLIFNGLDAGVISDYYVAMSYVNFGMFFLSRLVLSFLSLAVAYCFLSRPEAGVWRAVGQGLAEGVRRWPKCIGFWFCAVCAIQFALSILNMLLTQVLGSGAALWIMRSINVLLAPYFYLAAAQLASSRFRLKADTEKEDDYGTI